MVASTPAPTRVPVETEPRDGAEPADDLFDAVPNDPHANRLPGESINWVTSIVFILINLSPVLMIFTGVSRTAVVLCIVNYVARMFFITGGYHRYFAHRSYETSRVFQFILAFGGSSAAQKGPLWWAGHHRRHHRYTDTVRDLHSPIKGVMFSHVGWILSDRSGPTPVADIEDFNRFPELRFLNKHDWIAPWSLGILSTLIGGWSGLVVGFFLSTVLCWHATFLVNSACHLWGRRPFNTRDTSRNSWWVALLTFGEGWHNNHHHYPRSTRQGFRWWEYDLTFYILRLLASVGIVWNLRPPSPKALAARTR